MKKIFFLILGVIAAMFVCTACNHDAESNIKKEPSAVKASEILSSLSPQVKFESTFDCKEYIFNNVNSKDDILSQFTQEDFLVLDVDTVEGATFETVLLTKADELVTAYWFASTGELRLLYETVSEQAISCLRPNESTGTGSITVAQVGTERVGETDNPLNGMCYVIKLADGKAIIIDGGFFNSACADNLYNTLGTLGIAKDAEGDYLIEAWIFTHGHSDHIGIMHKFAPSYAEQVKIAHFLYQLPSELGVAPYQGNESVFHKVCRRYFPDAVQLIPHAGLRYYFGNVTLDMLYTPDLVWSYANRISYYNDTSLIFKLNGGSASVFFYGDAGEMASINMLKCYEPSAFKSDILQITHHGLFTGGANAEHVWHNLKKVYDATKATYALLPMQARYLTGDERNGRYTVLIQWSKSGHQISYVTDLSDNHGLSYFDQAYYNAFCDSVKAGTNAQATLFGYDGINKIVNKKGLVTYMGANEYDPMITIFSLEDGDVTVVTNQMLHSWLEANGANQ